MQLGEEMILEDLWQKQQDLVAQQETFYSETTAWQIKIVNRLIQVLELANLNYEIHQEDFAEVVEIERVLTGTLLRQKFIPNEKREDQISAINRQLDIMAEICESLSIDFKVMRVNKWVEHENYDVITTTYDVPSELLVPASSLDYPTINAIIEQHKKS